MVSSSVEDQGIHHKSKQHSNAKLFILGFCYLPTIEVKAQDLILDGGRACETDIILAHVYFWLTVAYLCLNSGKSVITVTS
jgi:hypothetical protein